MTMCAIIPIANLDEANKKLEAAGFGPGNFSVPAYTALSRLDRHSYRRLH